jgi:hypothetical protein
MLLQESQNRDLQDQLADANLRAISLSKQLEAARGRVDELEQDLAGAYLELQKSRSAAKPEKEMMLRVEELRRDNGRLLELLAWTDSFKDFVRSYAANEDLTYIPASPEFDLPPSYYAQLARLSKMYDLQDDRGVKPKRENQYWVPTEAHRVAQDFRARLLPEFPAGFFADLLVALNSVWFQREKRKVAALEAEHAKQIADLHRKLSQRVPYDKVVDDAERARLKKRVQSAHASSRSARDDDFVETTLRTVDTMAEHMQTLQRANDALGARQEELERQTPAEGVAVGRLALHMALTTVRNVSNLLEQHQDRSLRLVEDLDQRDAKGKRAASVMMANQKELAQRINEEMAFFRRQVGKLVSQGVVEEKSRGHRDDGDDDDDDDQEGNDLDEVEEDIEFLTSRPARASLTRVHKSRQYTRRF